MEHGKHKAPSMFILLPEQQSQQWAQDVQMLPNPISNYQQVSTGDSVQKNGSLE